jgi:HEAT repeat protein
MGLAPARPTAPGAKHQLSLIAESLLKPKRLSLSQAVRIASALCKQARDFDVRLLEVLESEPRTVAEISRALQILTQISDGRRLVAGMQRLVARPEPSIRAQASFLAARGVHNREWIARHLEDPDPRVRANVIEGSWTWLADRNLLLQAARDSHHRVACNALIRLHRVGSPEVPRLIQELAKKPDPRFRIALAWAIGETLDPSLQPHLLHLRSDSDARVRWKALHALRRIMVHGSGTLEAAEEDWTGPESIAVPAEAPLAPAAAQESAPAA